MEALHLYPASNHPAPGFDWEARIRDDAGVRHVCMMPTFPAKVFFMRQLFGLVVDSESSRHAGDSTR